jgi:ABC-type transport system involved in multi-copper enzyme maturation permease subunit
VRAPAFLAVLFLSAAAVAAVVLFASTALQSGRLPGEAGRLLLEWYFGASTVLVALVSSVYAAGAVARDADAGVVDALAVAGFSPWRTLGGKLLALWGVSCLVLVAAAPASVVPVLLGGTVPAAILVGHLYLALVSLWSIAFGLAVSTRLGAARSSTIVAVAVTLPASVALLAGSSYLAAWARAHWAVPSTGPFWPATAVALGLGPARLVFLVVLPLLTTFGALWYLAATAVGPLLPPSEDRGRGARLWIPVASGLLIVGVVLGRVLLAPRAGRDFALAAMGAELAIAVIAALTIAGEPLSPTSRTRSWVLGPGLAPASVLLACCGAATIVALALALHCVGVSPWPPSASTPAIATLAAWVVCIAAVGHALRSALPSATIARVVLGGLALGLAVALPDSSIADAAFWSPWRVLRNAPHMAWTVAWIPVGITIVALAVSTALAVVRGRRR